MASSGVWLIRGIIPEPLLLWPHQWESILCPWSARQALDRALLSLEPQRGAALCEADTHNEIDGRHAGPRGRVRQETAFKGAAAVEAARHLQRTRSIVTQEPELLQHTHTHTARGLDTDISPQNESRKDETRNKTAWISD